MTEEIPIDVDTSTLAEADARSANEPSKTPVRDAFNAGVLGGPLPNIPIPDDPNATPAPVPHHQDSPPIDLAREAAAGLDEARAFAAKLASADGEISDRLLAAADPLIDRLDAMRSEIERAKGDIVKAVEEAASRYRDLPGIDANTRKQVESAARQKARDDVMKERATKLDKLANETRALAAIFEKQLSFESRFADHDLREALDGHRRTEERSSEDYLVSYFEGESLSGIGDAYDLLVQSSTAKDLDRVRRFERAALRHVDALLAKSDEDLAPGVTKHQSAEKKERAERLKEQARQLRRTIEAQRESRRPAAIGHGEQLLEALHAAWSRLAGFDARRGAGAVSAAQINAMNNDDSKMAAARAQARSWKPMEGWHGRHFRKAK